MILKNTLHAFIENDGLTLIELPIFYRDVRFRNYVIGNIRYNWQVRDYWTMTFASKSRRLQEEQLEAAQTRAEILLGQPFVSDILGQSKSTLNFLNLMKQRKIILVNLSANLSYETKKIIGTLLISELLDAVEQRPADEREQFCIYVDEFQTFAAYQDFSTLITQAPKYGVTTTLAHHERYGQLARNPDILGATAAIANKVMFHTTPRDADELSREFAEEPTTETRYEDGYIISREPVWDILRWHDNPKIREFANKYIRPLKERLEDIKGEQETERLIRTEYLDEANLYRISEQLEGYDRHALGYDRERKALSSAGRLIEQASGQTVRLMTLNEEATHIIDTFRALNKLFYSAMDRTIDAHSPEFINYVVTGIATMAGLTDIQIKAIRFYLTVRTAAWYVVSIAFDIAKAYDLFPEEVRKNEKEVDDDWQGRKSDYMKEYSGCWWYDFRKLDKYVDHKQKPKRITAGIGSREIEQTLRAIYEHNKSVIETLQEFIEVCGLLSVPDNHIVKRSGQHVAKQVNIRNEQDMSNEMARKLTELPYYTAYAKVLPSWKGRIITLPLRELHQPFGMRVIKERIPLLLSGRIISQTVDCIGEGYSIIEQYSRRYMKTRAEIEREIRERHERLAGARDKEPPPMDAPTSQEPMPVERLKDILSMRLSRSQIVPEDELPPTHS